MFRPARLDPAATNLAVELLSKLNPKSVRLSRHWQDTLSRNDRVAGTLQFRIRRSVSDAAADRRVAKVLSIQHDRSVSVVSLVQLLASANTRLGKVSMMLIKRTQVMVPPYRCA